MNAKRNFCFTFALPAAASVLLLLGSCGNRTTAASAETDNSAGIEELDTDSIEWNDSLSTPGGSKALCSIAVEYPDEGPANAVDSVRAWIASQLATNSYVSDPSNPAPYGVEPSLRADGSKLLAATGRKVLEAARPDLLAYDTLRYNPPMTLEFMWRITELDDTDLFVTFGCSTYAYMGGAHGSSAYNGQTFRLSDGARIGWNMFPAGALDKVRTLVTEGLRTQFFKSATEEEFRQQLLLAPDATEIPLPTAQPYFMDNGVHFDYQQYEIAPYSEGMPSCVIPYSVIKPLLTPEAAALIPR